MKTDFTNVIYLPQAYSRVTLQQGQPVLDADPQESISDDATSKLKQFPQEAWPTVSSLGEHLLLAQLQKADLGGKYARANALAVTQGDGEVQVETKAVIEPGLIDSREERGAPSGKGWKPARKTA